MKELLFIFGVLFIGLGINFLREKSLRLLAGNLWGDENNNVNSEAAKKWARLSVQQSLHQG
ncbi:hypothetical protein [Limosilactobacillus ingluviei]|uniref:hypothetical protein n=1 Tax=Limosilactobacillus ingluviei TaxID=148604 RepID=UPI0024B9FA1D|nr:hypothetical protein [Limosilactobacillus ingluviei]